MTGKWRKSLRWMALLAVSGALLLVTFRIGGVEDFLRDLQRFPVWTVAVVAALFSLNLAAVSFRLARMLSHFGVTLPAGAISRASVSGHLAGLFIMSLFGQVVGRHLVLRRFGIPPMLIANLTAYERIVLLLVSGGLCMIGAVVLLDHVVVARFMGNIPLLEIALVAGSGAALSLWLGRSVFETQLIARLPSRKAILNVMEIAAVTLAAQLMILTTFIVGVLALKPDIDLWHLFAAAAITSFAASLPVSINGWGIRELAAVYTLGQLGVPTSSALAVSVLVGLCSTAVILAAAPLVLKRPADSTFKAFPGSIPAASVSGFDIERVAAWMLAMAAAVLIFFQVHVTLPGGVVNLNLADPFAILALAIMVMHAVSTRQLPRWRPAKFNMVLAAISVLLVFAFLRGSLEIGITQWALAGRLTGWLVLLGYLGLGYLAVAYMGGHGLRRFAETMITTGAVIVLLQIVVRGLGRADWVDGSLITSNFEGHAGNRNAFAFQMLVCSSLALAYSLLQKKAGNREQRLTTSNGADSLPGGIMKLWRAAGGSRPLLFSLLHGVILAGIAFSASRAGLITGAVLLVTAWTARLSDRRMLVLSVVFAVVVWTTPLLSMGPGAETIQSRFSNEVSNQERWETIGRGFFMWLESPWFGAGLGVFIERSAEWFRQPLVIHSTPVWILAEFGLLGVAVFVGVFVMLARYLGRSGMASVSSRIVAMLLLVFVIFGLVHEIFYQRIFWLVLGAGLAVSGRVFYTDPGIDIPGHHDELAQAPVPGH